MRDGHWLYAIGDYDIIFFFATNLLRALYAATSNGRHRYRRYETPTSQGFLLPEPDAAKYAALILRPDASGKVDERVATLEDLAKNLHAVILENPAQLRLF